MRSGNETTTHLACNKYETDEHLPILCVVVEMYVKEILKKVGWGGGRGVLVWMVVPK